MYVKNLLLRICCLAVTVLPVTTISAWAGVTLVEDGQARSVIVLPEGYGAQERLAATELSEHIALISGVELDIIAGEDVPDGKVPVYIGDPSEEMADAIREADAGELRPMGLDAGSFALWGEDDGIHAAGLTPEGTQNAVYELLEQQGVRWYMPGELGRVIPQSMTVRVERQRTVQAPSFAYRRLQNVGRGHTIWGDRVRQGGESRSTGGHNLPGGVPRGTEGRQACLSGVYAPGGVEAVVEHIRSRYEPADEEFHIGMGPRDGHGYCECEGCVELDGDVHDPWHGDTSVTGRYIWFFNRVLEELEDDYPNLHIAWYVYARHRMPPPEGIEPNPRIVHVFAPIMLDRIRGMDNPMSPDRHGLRWVIDRWSEYEPNYMYYRGYYYNLASPQFPFSQFDRIRTETPAFYERNFAAMRVETRPSWSVHTPSLYLAMRMMWDVNTDVDALLEEFYEKFYGPAREPMQSYHERLEAAFRDTPYFTGSAYSKVSIFLGHPRRDELRALLDEAAEKAEEYEDSVYAERVAAIRIGWDRFDAFLDMMEARREFDFASALASFNEVNRLGEKMGDYVLEEEDVRRTTRSRSIPKLLEAREAAGGFNNRFFRHAVETGYERTVEKGQLVAGLPDEWDFLLDPVRIGEIAGYYRKGEIGGNWQRKKTTSATWSDQGLHYEKGPAWYRTEIVIPEEFQGRPIYLWFGGVHEQAWVWVNEKYLGSSDKPEHGLPGMPGSFRAFDMDASNAVTFGSEVPNTVAVKISHESTRLGELGLRGIFAPVMFWTPDDPEWKPWE